MSTTFTLDGATRLQQEIRKSRFLAQAAPVDDADAALAHVARVSASDATHNCWAYRIGANYRFSDDGEPGGSAGRPILAAIEGQGLDRVVVVVTRWFGGIKLGVGGLVRAYGGCAAECLRLAAKRELVERARVVIHCDYAAAATLYAKLRDFDAARHAEAASADGAELHIDLPTSRVAELRTYVRDLTRGRGTVDSPT
ncbi:YigZ family protein [Dokdonella soli]|uniref:IMPACT family protein n=1 Tax=Dokdonella soli TaxID=529810 RepID=A0ABN1IDN8_9GAMM